MNLAWFVARRVVLTVPLLLGIVLFTFLLVRVGGQDPVALLAGPTATAAELHEMRSALALDQPIWVQFWLYLKQLLTFDLGMSWTSNRPVAAELLERVPATLELLVGAMLVGSFVGIPVGLRAAFRPGGTFDNAARVVALLGFSIPTYWLGLVALFVFFYLLDWAPPGMGRISLMLTPPPHVTGSYVIDAMIAGDWEAVRSAASQLALPIACVGLVAGAPIANQTRAIAITAMNSEHVRYARTAGLPQRLVRRIVLRTILAPLITFLGVETVTLVGTTALIEYIFAWGGVGYLGLNAMIRGDFAVVQGYALLMGVFSVVVFLIVDIIVLLLDPRARAGA